MVEDNVEMLTVTEFSTFYETRMLIMDQHLNFSYFPDIYFNIFTVNASMLMSSSQSPSLRTYN